MTPPSAPFRISLPLLALIVVVAAHGAWAAHAGIRMAPDSRFYAESADRLLAMGWDYGEFLRPTPTLRPPVQYLGFISVVALGKSLFGSGWVYMCLLLNLLAQALAAALLVALVQRLTRSRVLAAVAMVLYVACYDLTAWTGYPLTDAVYLGLSFSLFAYLAWDLLAERPRSWAAFGAGAAGLLLLCLFWRPTAPALFPLVGAAVWLRYRGAAAALDPKQRPRLERVLGLLVLAAFGVMVLFALLMRHPDWPPVADSWAVKYFAAMYQKGMVIHSRPETYHAPPHTYLEYLAIAGDRLLQFFAVSARGFSTGHKVQAALWFVPVYLSAGLAVGSLLRDRGSWGEAEARVACLSVVMILATSVFHALLLVDYDWRYRVPVLPHLILLATLGLALLIRRWDPEPKTPAEA